MHCVLRSFQNKGLARFDSDIIIASLRSATTKEYQCCWKRYVFWCFKWNVDPYSPSETDVVKFLTSMMRNKVSYSVLNTHKSMLINTLPYFDVTWINGSNLIPKLMRGYFNLNPTRPKVRTSWDVSKVLSFLRSLVPLHKLSLRLLTFKLITLIALTTASRAQTLLALDLKCMSVFTDKVVFQINKLLKTCKPGTPVHKVVLHRFSDKKLCVVSTLSEYLSRTKHKRKSSSLFISCKTFNIIQDL